MGVRFKCCLSKKWTWKNFWNSPQIYRQRNWIDFPKCLQGGEEQCANILSWVGFPPCEDTSSTVGKKCMKEFSLFRGMGRQEAWGDKCRLKGRTSSHTPWPPCNKLCRRRLIPSWEFHQYPLVLCKLYSNCISSHWLKYKANILCPTLILPSHFLHQSADPFGQLTSR